MLLYITIGILLAYTIILIGFFMGWCTLIPTKCHPRKGIPFSSVKSPRRNTKFVEIDSISSSTSLDVCRQVPRKFSKSAKKLSLNVPSRPQPYKVNDYLHPKYSLPPVDMVDGRLQWEFHQLLRTPGRSVRQCSSNPPSQKVSECESVVIQIN
ncbi:unnamed protein product [Auanema sp. JU1783]|nr:unnamed protein product [Auanema sp. JU1783]